MSRARVTILGKPTADDVANAFVKAARRFNEIGWLGHSFATMLCGDMPSRARWIAIAALRKAFAPRETLFLTRQWQTRGLPVGEYIRGLTAHRWWDAALVDEIARDLIDARSEP